MNGAQGALRSAVAYAGSFTGKRFGMLVASSLVATSAIVASALTTPGDNGPLAALLGRTLASDNPPAAVAPAAVGGTTGVSDSPNPARGGSRGRDGGVYGAPAVPASPAPSEGGGDAPGAPATPSSPLPQAGRIKHVFVISLASPGYEQSFGDGSQMPYLSATLRPKGELLANYSLLDGAGLPNSIAAISGQPPNPQTQGECSFYSEFSSTSKPDDRGVVQGAGCVYPVDALTLADQLTSARFRWRAYVEGMVDGDGNPHNCVHPDSGGMDQPALGGYAARRNPFVYFHSLLDLGDCAINDVPLTELGSDLRKADETPNFSFISPSLCDAGVSGQCPAGIADGAAAADGFLSQWVPKILASPAYRRDGLLIVDFDEADSSLASGGDAPAAVGALLLSRYVTRGATDSGDYNPYSMLRSTEDLFGLDHLGRAAGAKVRSFAPGLLGTAGGD